MKPTKTPHGSERDLDEQRTSHGPQYEGADWKAADADKDVRIGHAHKTDAEPDLTAAEVASGGEHAGMGRGEKPRKTKSREG